MSEPLVITGAAGGLGREFALGFARRGDRVLVADIDEQGAAETAQLVLVTFEHPVEGLGRRRRAVLRHQLADLGLGQRPTGVEEHEHEVEEALGLGGRARRCAHVSDATR